MHRACPCNRQTTPQARCVGFSGVGFLNGAQFTKCNLRESPSIYRKVKMKGTRQMSNSYALSLLFIGVTQGLVLLRLHIIMLTALSPSQTATPRAPNKNPRRRCSRASPADGTACSNSDHKAWACSKEGTIMCGPGSI